jgi:integrase
MAYIKGQTSQGTIFKIGDVYYANYRRNGRQIKKSLGTKDRGIALFKFQQLIAHPIEGTVQFGAIVRQTVEAMKVKGLKSSDTVVYHAKAVHKALGHMRVHDISAATLERVVLQWHKKVKPATINRRCHVIRQALKYAQRHGYITQIPAIPRLSEHGNARQGFFTQEEFETLYAVMPSYLQDVSLFAYLTGWRKSEILSLPWASVDWKTMTVRLSTSKNSESRVFPIVDTRLETLLRHRQELTQGSLVFHRNGLPVGDCKRCWNTANKRVGMDKLFHDLRRTAVRNFIAQGLPERLVMALTGHKTNHMLHRYHVVVEQDLRAALSKNNPSGQSRVA